MMKLLATLTCALCLTGCTVVTYTSPEGHVFMVERVWSNAQIGSVRVVRPDGTEVIIEGYSSEEMATKALAALAARAAGGTP